MYRSLYEQEKVNKINYDDIREYCKAEQVNEEYLRYSIRKNGLEDKPTIKNIILAILIFIIIGLGISYIYNKSSETESRVIYENQALVVSVWESEKSRKWL